MRKGLGPSSKLPGVYTSLGFRSAEVARNDRRSLPHNGSADAHLRRDRQLLVALAHRFDRDNGIYQAILNRAEDAILGTGFSLQSKTDDEDLNDRIESDWKEFGRKPEVRTLFDWRDCERLSLRAIFNGGDLGVIRTNRMRFQFVEADQIDDGLTSSLLGRRFRDRGDGRGKRAVEQGVELDGVGRPVAYFVMPDEGRAYRSRIRVKARKIPADQMILPANRMRYSQTRGIPILTATFSMIHRLNDVLDSEAIAWQNLAKFALAVSRKGSAEQAYIESEADDDGKDSPPDVPDRVMELAEGILFFGEPGEEVKGIERVLPGKQFPEAVRMFLRLAGLPVGLPLEIILLDYSKTNYTGSRAALEQAFNMFRRWQRFLKRQHHTPLYLWWLQWQIERGIYPGPAEEPTIFDHEWIAPEFPWIDQLKEAQAWGERMDRGLATQTLALQSTNQDRGEFLDQREREIREAIQRAQQISEETGTDVDWRYLAGIPVGQTTQAVRETAVADSDSGGDS